MQKASFTNGGYVLHKMTVPGSSSRFSAWFDAAGTLLDAERIDHADRGYRPGRLQWEHLQRVGRWFMGKPGADMGRAPEWMNGRAA